MSGLIIDKVPSKQGKEYIKTNHYSGSCHNGPMCWGLFDNEILVGVCAFATPCSENVRSSIFGPEEKSRVTELHRLHTQDYLPKNTTSWFVSRSVKGLMDYRPDIRAIISFADSAEGHIGTIYKALNFEYKGMSSPAWFYRDEKGSLRHPRQNGVNISKEEAAKRSWTREKRDSKFRYLLIIGNNKTDKKYWKRKALI